MDEYSVMPLQRGKLNENSPEARMLFAVVQLDMPQLVLRTVTKVRRTDGNMQTENIIKV